MTPSRSSSARGLQRSGASAQRRSLGLRSAREEQVGGEERADLVRDRAEARRRDDFERARTRNIDVDDLQDPARARRHHHNAVGEEHRFGDRVGDQQDGLAARRQMRCSSRFMWSRVIASSAPNGSSISRIGGSYTARGRSRRAAACRPKAGWDSLLEALEPDTRRSSIARSRYPGAAGPCTSIGSMTFSGMVRQGSSSGLWNTMPTSLRGSVTGLPATVSRPGVGRRGRRGCSETCSCRNRDGPTMVTNSPSRIDRSMRERLDRTVLRGLIDLADRAGLDDGAARVRCIGPAQGSANHEMARPRRQVECGKMITWCRGCHANSRVGRAALS